MILEHSCGPQLSIHLPRTVGWHLHICNYHPPCMFHLLTQTINYNMTIIVLMISFTCYKEVPFDTDSFRCIQCFRKCRTRHPTSVLVKFHRVQVASISISSCYNIDLKNKNKKIELIVRMEMNIYLNIYHTVCSC